MAISGNKLYAVGGANYGSVASYLLADQSTPPTVSLISPTDSARRLAPANIRLTATASNSTGSITKVEFYNGDSLLHTAYAIPYSFVWTGVPVGDYTLTAKAYDAAGLSATSEPVQVSVVPNQPPVVSIVSPVNNRAFADPGYIHFQAIAKDADGRITRVEFYNGSTLLRTEYEAPYTYVWKAVPTGAYTITAVAVDNWGAKTTSSPITVRVIPRTTIVSAKASSNINENNTKNAFEVFLYPNPVKGILNVSTTGLHLHKPSTLSVISASGAIVKTVQRVSSKLIQLDVSSLVSGVYTVRLINGDKILYKQFVKQ
jgi:hypothetical protein